MTSVDFILSAILLLGLSGMPSCVMSPRSAAGQRIATGFVLMGSLLGLTGVWLALDGPATTTLSRAWGLPSSRFALRVDPLSVVFLLPVFVVPALGSLYGLAYWKQAEHPTNGRRLGLAYGLLAGAMALVVVAADGLLFLIAWEAMALAAYFAATAEDDQTEVRRAGWIYLIATHMGTVCLLALFAFWHHSTGSFGLDACPSLPLQSASALFALALVGFGFKAGLMPLHVWLPGAHANAPSHVSAVMSGVMLKMGVYGIVRVTALLPDGSLWWGATTLALGVVSSVAGIAYAIGQRDLKRVLAYSSIENVGIIMIGLGLALLGRTLGHPTWVLLGLGGALLHVWNHSLFKSLLFLNAGAVIHAVGTREIDRMGGLAKRMPDLLALFVVGAVAICALPPLNGFASEWLLYVGLFRTLGDGPTAGAPAAALAAAALAVTGALAVACFVRVLGAVFLGEPRRKLSHHAHETPLAMRVPMLALACACVAVGLFPSAVVPPLEAGVELWASSPVATPITELVPLTWLTPAGLGLAAFAGLLFLGATAAARSQTVRGRPTWDCGYARPSARMQYTGSSSGASLVSLTSFLLWPKRFRSALRGVFPKTTAFRSRVPDMVLDRLVVPLFHTLGRILPRLRVLQQGQIHVYLLYILAITIILLVWGNAGD